MKTTIISKQGLPVSIKSLKFSSQIVVMAFGLMLACEEEEQKQQPQVIQFTSNELFLTEVPVAQSPWFSDLRRQSVDRWRFFSAVMPSMVSITQRSRQQRQVIFLGSQFPRGKGLFSSRLLHRMTTWKIQIELLSLHLNDQLLGLGLAYPGYS